MRALRFKVLIPIFMTLALTSCVSKRNNIIVSGHYSGVVSENQMISCDLLIEPISENEFLNANGKNVIKDAINDKYYSIDFFVNTSINDIQQVDFLNFRDAHDRARGAPISYVDDSNYWLTPFTSENNEVLPEGECYYSVHINSNDFELFAFLYFMED